MGKDVTISTDVLIIGGGLVGATLAKALSTLDLHVTLVEKNFLGSALALNIIDIRALALNFGTLNIFKNLLNLDLSGLGTLVKTIYVSEQKGFGRVALDAAQENLPYFGAVIPIVQLTQLLQEIVQQDPKIDCLAGECVALNQNDVGVTCELSAGQKIQAKLVVGADGANSKVRALLNIPSSNKDFQQSALIGNVKMRGVLAHTAFERFTSQGPLALLPLDHEHMTLVWVMPNSLALMREALPAELVLADLQAIMGYRAGKFVALGQWQKYPLTQVVAEQTYQGRVGLLGNAAHSLHPVAAQGFNLSMRDIFGFYQTLKRYQEALTQPEIIWQEYMRVRGHDQVRTERLTNTLLHLFMRKNPLIKFTRNSLLLNLELCPPAKTMLNELMVGLT